MAISFNSASYIGEGTGTSTTDTLTVPTLNAGLAVVGIEGDTIIGNNDIVSVTLGGVAMTSTGNTASVPLDRFIYCYFLLNPPPGSQNLVITFGSSHIIGRVIGYYEGVKQSGQPDAHASSTAVTPPLATSVTTVADNCWVIGHAKSAGGVLSAGSGTTLRTSGSNQFAIADTNGVVHPAGTGTINTTNNTNQGLGSVIASFAPTVSSGNMFLVL